MPAGDPVVVQSTTVIIGENGLSLLGISCRNGDVRWRLDVADPAWRAAGGRSFRAVADGAAVYLDTRANHGVVAIDPAKGSVLWSHRDPMGAYPWEQYVTDLVPVGDRLLTNYGALDAKNGMPLWALDVGHGVPTIAAVGELVVTASAEGIISRLSPANGEPLWKETLAPLVAPELALDEGSIAVIGYRDGPTSAAREVQLLDARSGKAIWRVPIRADHWAKRLLSVDADSVYVTGHAMGQRITAFRREDGGERWTQKIDGGVQGPAVVAGEALFASSRDTVTAIDRRTGSLRWRTDVR
jgi:outer membrane protein assembly factor BamB